MSMLNVSKPLMRFSMLAAASLLLAGCGSTSSWFKVACAKPGDFAGVIDNPPLKIPPDRDAPDTRSALSIPVLDTPEAPRPADNPCIDTPPKFTPAAPNRPQA
jgi:hypothetical protein